MTSLKQDETMQSDPQNNRYYRCANELIRAYGTLGPKELGRRANVGEDIAYRCILAFRGVTQALREHNYLPNDDDLKEEVIELDTSDVLTLEEAQKVLKGPQLVYGETTAPARNYRKRARP